MVFTMLPFSCQWIFFDVNGIQMVNRRNEKPGNTAKSTVTGSTRKTTGRLIAI
jgi:hypothetical protein